MYSSKTQMALEFVIIVALILVITLIFVATVYLETKSVNSKRLFLGLQDLGESVQSEILLAATSKSGYSRSFTLPSEVADTSYNISIQSNQLILTSGEYEVSFSIPSVVGGINKGSNRIANRGGVVYLN
ncbi:hypothetical protein DRJ48_00715 [Candidatus Woesearchaeota archaeon]|nr:MAG: hypothetical protein DRJ48_00715 [Candidatus Woesearchaeota archaeon]